MTVLFELDGCIADNRHRIGAEPYEDYSSFDTPVNVSMVRHWVRRGAKVSIVTHRVDKPTTLRWLARWFPDVTFDKVLFGLTTPEDKAAAAQEIGDVVVAYDSDLKVLSAYGKAGIKSQFLGVIAI